MDNRPAGLSAIAVALMGIFAISLPLSHQSSGSSTTSMLDQSSAVAQGIHHYPEHSAFDMMLDAIDRDPDQFPSTDANSKDFPWKIDFSGATTQSLSPAYRVQFLIATVPLPATPGLRFGFDSTVDSIQRAAYHAHFVIDSFYLPWKRADNSESGIKLADAEEASVTTPNGPLHLDIKNKSNDRSYFDPGIILFRNDHDNPPDQNGRTFLVVFLVGETPTTGVEKQQLMNALEQEAFMSRHFTAPPGYIFPENTFPKVSRASANQVRILGPSYTGSAFSLQTVLTTWLDIDPIKKWAPETPGKDPKNSFVRIVSGGATGIDLQRQFTDPRMSFRATVLPDAKVITSVKQYIESLGGQPSELAILSEGDTAYGQSSVAEQNKDPSRSPLQLTFPLHISQLRKQFEALSGSPAGAVQPLGHRNVALPDEADNNEDVIGDFSPRSSTYSDLTLEGLFRTIKYEGIKFIYIVATDTEDLVFLAQQIRENVPNTVLMTADADVLYLHSDFNVDLQGMFVFSNYPLFGPAQSWFDSGDRALAQFPRNSIEGVYNAELALLGNPDFLDYGMPLAADNTGSQPPLWIGMVGSSTIWPIDVEPVEAATYVVQSPSTPRDLHPGTYPFAFRAVFYAFNVFAICSAACLLCFYPVMMIGLGFSVPGPIRSVFGDASMVKRRLNRILYHLAILVVLIAAFIIIVAAGIRVMSPTQYDLGVLRSFWFGVLVSSATMTLLILAVFGVTRGLATEWRYRTQSGVLYGGWLFLIVAATALLFALVFAFATLMNDRRTLFLCLRMADLGGGASPLLPIVYLSIAVLAVIMCDLRRLYLLDACGLPQPFLVDGSVVPSFAGIDRLEKHLWRLLRRRGFKLPGAPLVLIALAVILAPVSVYFFRHSTPGAKLMGLFTAALATFVYAMLLLIFIRFTSIWWTLRRLLRRLYWHPTRGAYAKLRVNTAPKGGETQQSIKLVEPQPTFTAVEYCLQQARALVGLLGKPDRAPWITNPEAWQISFTTGILWTEAVLGSTLAGLESTAKAADPQNVFTLRMRMQQILSGLSGEICRAFENFWRVESPGSLAPRRPSESAIVDAAELFIASRVVEFLRQIFPQLINLASFGIVGVVGLTLAAASYPFPDRDAIMLLSWLILLSTLVLLTTMFMQVGRDRIISLLHGTTPGRLNFDADFIVRMGLFVVLPILTLLGAQFPHTIGQFVSWLGGHLGSSHS
ncbi:MAG: hypothetical protein ACLQDV_23700 [Candidatus Binataceae bacterium]